MKKDELKIKITNYNNLYRAGEPVISDSEYDALLEKFKAIVSESEYMEFRETLFEKPGKVKHDYIMGSLEKIDYDNDKALQSFITKNDIKKIFASEKLDGFSVVCKYSSGKLVYALTRGDGLYGEDITEIVRRLGINISRDGVYRGEIILTGDWHTKNGFSNRRNCVIGIFGNKNITDDMLSSVKIKFYNILDSDETIEKQFEIMKSNKIDTPNYWVIDVDENLSTNLISLLQHKKDYDCDGLVISSIDNKNENVKLPKTKKAFKGKDQEFITTIKEIEWAVTKSERLTPVAVVDDINIGGANISRATLHNINFIKENNICIGDEVTIIRSHDIIPQIIKNNKPGNSNIMFPKKCPHCNGDLIQQGAFLSHVNPDSCPETLFLRTVSFVENIGIKDISKSILKKLKIFSIKDLLNFKIINKNSIIQKKLLKEINDKIFRGKIVNLITSLYWGPSVGTKSILKYIELTKKEPFEAIQNIDKDLIVKSKVGIGIKFYDQMIKYQTKNVEILREILNDSRCKITSTHIPVKEKVSITGKLSISRKEFLEKNNLEYVSTISKNISRLIVGENPTTHKVEKAKNIGLKIVNEKGEEL